MFMYTTSSYIRVENQLGLSSAESICDKQTFEKLSLEHGVTVEY